MFAAALRNKVKSNLKSTISTHVSERVSPGGGRGGVTDLMSPPHHHVGEHPDPQDGADERTRKILSGLL